MAKENNSWSISTKVWDRAGIKLATPGSAVRQLTDCYVAQHEAGVTAVEASLDSYIQQNLCKTATLKKTKKCFSRLIIA